MKPTAKNLMKLPRGTHRLDHGIFLCVKANGSRYWVFKYQKDKKRWEIGIGSTDQSIEQIRGRAAKLRAMIVDGQNPKRILDAAQGKAKKERELIREERLRQLAPTFGEFYEDAYKQIAFLRQWKGTKTASEFRYLIEKFAMPSLRDRLLPSITRDDMAYIVRPLWERPYGTRLLSNLRAIFEYAKALKHVDSNPAEWKGNLDALLPSPSKIRRGKKQRHHAALPPEELREVAHRLLAHDALPAKMLVFGMLTVGRFSEYAKARWTEIDFEAGTLSVPPERRKDKRVEDFIVPLPKQALSILRGIPKIGEFIFSRNGSAPFATVTGHAYLERVNASSTTIHGFRSSFSDWCAKNDKNPIVSEKCLMHAVGNQVFRAYQRDDLLDKRRQLLQEWADFLLGE